MARVLEPVTIGSRVKAGQRDPLDQIDFALDAKRFADLLALLDQPPAPTDGLRRTLMARAPWDADAPEPSKAASGQRAK